MNENRGSWYLLTGLVIGLSLGLIYAWVISPLKYVDTTPASLREDYKDHYRAMIAVAYVADGDLTRARARLDLLGDSDMYQALAEQAKSSLADGSPSGDARALGMLSVALGQGAGLPVGTAAPGIGLAEPTITRRVSQTSLATATRLPTAIPSPVPSDTSAPATEAPLPSPSPTALPTSVPQPTSTEVPTALPTFTPLPTRTTTPTPGAPFVLESRQLVCDKGLPEPLIEVFAFDAAGKPVPGVEVVVTWGDGQEEHFYTGLKPEMGLGYADFTMTPDVVYNLRLAEGGQPITDLNTAECEVSGGGRFWGAWQLKFAQP